MLDVENDVDGLDPKLREVGRYFSTKYSTLERHKDFKHVRVVATVKSLAVPGEFIPLTESPSSREQCNNESVTKLEIEESWDDEVLRKTKEFNKMSREFPHDEKVWVAFAEFQVCCYHLSYYEDEAYNSQLKLSMSFFLPPLNSSLVHLLMTQIVHLMESMWMRNAAKHPWLPIHIST